MGCRAEKMRRDSPPPHIFANNIIRRAKTEAERQSINIFPTQIYEPSAVLGLSNVHESKKERLRWANGHEKAQKTRTRKDLICMIHFFLVGASLYLCCDGQVDVVFKYIPITYQLATYVHT